MKNIKSLGKGAGGIGAVLAVGAILYLVFKEPAEAQEAVSSPVAKEAVTSTPEGSIPQEAQRIPQEAQRITPGPGPWSDPLTTIMLMVTPENIASQFQAPIENITGVVESGATQTGLAVVNEDGTVILGSSDEGTMIRSETGGALFIPAGEDIPVSSDPEPAASEPAPSAPDSNYNPSPQDYGEIDFDSPGWAYW